MKTTIFSIGLAVSLSGGLVAQPTIQMSDFTPEIGTTYTNITTQYVAQGQEGANQNWDFSELDEVGVITQTYLDPSGQPGASNFPTANYVQVIGDGDSYTYTLLANNYMELLGIYTSEGDLLIDYSDTRLMVEFPLAFGNTFSDTYFRLTNFGFGVSNEEDGTASYEVTGYGTLTTPAGTFADVLQIKINNNSTLSTLLNGNVISEDDLTEESYVYYSGVGPLALATFSDVTFSGQAVSSGSYGDIELGTTERSPVVDLSVYPNPTPSDVNLNFRLERPQAVTVDLYSPDGRLLKNLLNRTLPSGSISLRYKLPEVPAGVYLLRISTQEGAKTHKVTITG